jgi:hypothetical protein
MASRMFDREFFEHFLSTGRPDLARRYVESDPPAVDVMTPEQAAALIAESSSAPLRIDPRRRLTCAQEAGLESSFYSHRYM